MKRCGKCKEQKATTEFVKDSSRKDKLTNDCKSCTKLYRQANSETYRLRSKAYYYAHKEKVSQYSKDYHIIHKEKLRLYNRDYRSTHKEQLRLQQKLYRYPNPEKRKQYMKDYYFTHKAKIRQYGKDHYIINKEKSLLQQKLYRQVNSEKIRQYRKDSRPRIRIYSKIYNTNRRNIDPLYKLEGNLRASCRRARSKFGIKTQTALLLGCTWAEAQAHLIQTAILKYGSYSEAPNAYHIDHKLPLSKATNAEEMVKRCHISNLRYLTPEDNMAKGARLDWEGDLCS
jgi:hypothetical protein